MAAFSDSRFIREKCKEANFFGLSLLQKNEKKFKITWKQMAEDRFQPAKG